MFWCVENKSQLDDLSKKGYKQSFIEVIPFHDKIHPFLNEISLIFLRPLESQKSYMVCIKHNESLSLDEDEVIQFLRSFDDLFTINKKQLLHYLPLNNSIDISYNINIKLPSKNNVQNHFYNLYPNNQNINTIIPIVKHFEYWDLVYDELRYHLPIERNKFNDKEDIVFYYIESRGINIVKDKFMGYYESSNEMHNIHDKTVYTQYNLHNTTRRPSNSFNNMNFAALNKENGVRDTIIPSNDEFIEIDFSAYHPHLISKIIGYEFEKPIYQTFSEYSGLNLEDSKKEVFRNLYGEVNKKYKNWEYFKLTQIYIKVLWDKFETKGYIECDISKKRFVKDELENMNPSKLFNYWLQLKETTNNVLILWDIIKILRNKNTKIVLYSYDAFLIDLDNNEKETIEEIKNILMKYKLDFKINAGKTYNFQ